MMSASPTSSTGQLELSPLERNFINHYQGNFPLQTRPFQCIAEALDSNEAQIIKTVQGLQQKKLLTRFGPLYDAAALGGGLSLAALSADDNVFDSVARKVNAFVEVAHNYRREHKLNMWFVLATESPAQIEQTLQAIEQSSGLKVYNFPKIKEFYIGLWLQLHEDNGISTVAINNKAEAKAQPVSLDLLDRQLISATQGGLPVQAAPYQTIANTLGISEAEVIHRLQQLLQQGIIRRIGAVPNHYKLGLHANGMSVWDVDENKIEQLGEQIGQLDFVSHCYQRPRHQPLWPYNLFAMLHGRNRDEVSEKTRFIKELLADDCHQHDILYSSAILKKTGLRLAA